MKIIWGQTYTQRKDEILDNIRVRRDVIRTLNTNINKYPDLRDDTLQSIQWESEAIATDMKELTELAKERVRLNLKTNEPYKGERDE